ncbi:MAG: AI-2E family transporter [Nanoarchaeota archaeon]
MEKRVLNKIVNLVLVAILVLLSLLVLKPVFSSIVIALILAFIFYPTYKKLFNLTKMKTLSAVVMCIFLILIVAIPIILLTPFLFKQVFDIYVYIQKTDLVAPFKTIFPSLFSNPELSKNIVMFINDFTSKITTSMLNKFTNVLLNSTTIILNSFLILIVFFFALRDGNELIQYIKSISPFTEEYNGKIINRFKDVTYSVIFGEIIVGLVQGIITGIGLFIFKVPNTLTLTLLAILVGILPILGPALVWIPADIYLFVNGMNWAGIGLLVYGLFIIEWIDIFLKPIIVGKKVKVNSAIILISMMGGLYVFGILGLILGPLIISYLILLLDFLKKDVN